MWQKKGYNENYEFFSNNILSVFGDDSVYAVKCGNRILTYHSVLHNLQEKQQLHLL